MVYLHIPVFVLILSAVMESADNALPELVSAHMLRVLQRLKDDGNMAAFTAMKAQLYETPAERHILPAEIRDPLGAHRFQVTARAVHQYKNRILVLTTGRCFANCRYCFRRCSQIKEAGFVDRTEQSRICEYLEHHPEIQEVLFSGGDCLTGTDDQISELIDVFRDAHEKSVTRRYSEDSLLIRICTRAPVFCPERITPQLIALMKQKRPLWVIPHINHPVEISERYSPESFNALQMIVDAGIPVQSQTVLLRGINDSVSVLSELFHKLTSMGIKPGYLFQGDLAPGTSHFRVPLQEGVRLYEHLRQELSGLSTPVYAVDLPGGGGKVNLLQLDPELMSVRIRKEGSSYMFTDENQCIWSYPF